MDEIIKSHPVLWLLAALITGFISGFGAFKGILAVGAHEIVRKDSYVLRSDVVGTLLRSESLRQLEHLLELGSSVDPASKEANTFMLRTLTFVHTLDLDKDGYGERSMAEERIDHIIRDIPNIGKPPALTAVKIQQICGVLHGIRDALASKAM